VRKSGLPVFRDNDATAKTSKEDAMANKGLFASAVARLLPAADAVNRELAPAYAYGPEHKLAQLAATGTLQDNFYSAAETQLAEVIAAAEAVDPLFVARTALYARKRGAMKDMPALLTAWLTKA
jgi:60 kDa SS-A/Ro ribonucleoprotein